MGSVVSFTSVFDSTPLFSFVLLCRRVRPPSFLCRGKMTTIYSFDSEGVDGAVAPRRHTLEGPFVPRSLSLVSTRFLFRHDTEIKVHRPLFSPRLWGLLQSYTLVLIETVVNTTKTLSTPLNPLLPSWTSYPPDFRPLKSPKTGYHLPSL